MLTLETEQPKSYNLKTKIAVAVATTATIGVIAAVGLSQTTSTTRQTTGLFNIPEDFKGHMSGGMANGLWTVQGKFHKFETASGDWQIDARVEFENGHDWPQVFTIVDNVVIYSDPGTPMECADRSEMAGYGKWAGLLDGAQVVSSSHMSEEQLVKIRDACPEGADAVALQFEGKTWTVCADSVANTRAMYAFDDDFFFSAVSRPGMTVDIALPAGAEKLNCTAFDPSVDRVEFNDALIQELDTAEQVSEEELRETGPDVVYKDNEIYQANKLGYKTGAEEKQLAFLQTDSEVSDFDRRQLYDDKVTSSDFAGTSGSDEWYPKQNSARYVLSNAALPSGDQKNCIFVHGSGARGTHGKTLRTEHDTGYWSVGKPHKHKKGKILMNIGDGIGKSCDHYAVFNNDSFNRYFDDGYPSGQGGPNKFAKVNTYTWEICYALKQYKKAGLESSTVVFTHSMGALVTRKAFESKTCGWRGKYYTNQGPMTGSKAANFTLQFCVTTYILLIALLVGTAVAGPGWALLWGVVAGALTYVKGTMLKAYCRMATALKNGKAFESIYNNYPIFSALPEAPDGRYAKADGRYCGISTKGYGISFDATALQAIHWFSFLPVIKTCTGGWYIQTTWYGAKKWKCHKYTRRQDGDGMVPRHSCLAANAVGKAQITLQPVNHGDGTGRYGSSTTASKDVYKWYRNRS